LTFPGNPSYSHLKKYRINAGASPRLGFAPLVYKKIPRIGKEITYETYDMGLNLLEFFGERGEES